MNNFTSLATAFVAISMSIPSFGQGITINPERVNHQDGSYDATSNTVTITAEAPTMTEYDWDTYTQQELPYISYIAIHRHRPGTEWSDEELGRITNPEPGKVIEFVDNTVEPDKQYEYGITVHVDDLQSQQAYLQIYTGITPGYLKSFTARAVPGNPNAVEMTAVAPDTAETGESLDGSILSIHVQQYSGSFSYSDIHTIDGVKPGQTYSWTLDNLESDKLYTFRAMAYVGNEGKGGFSEANVYLGLDYPGSPQNATCSQEGDGVRITWEAPAAGGRGGDYDPETGILHLGIPKGDSGASAIATPTSLGSVMPQTGHEDGLELETDGKLRVRKASASQRGGVRASTTAAANTVPQAGEDGTLDASWVPRPDCWDMFPPFVPVPIWGATPGGSDGRRAVMPGEEQAREEWILCDGGSDGKDGTVPDLRGRYVRGASEAEPEGTEGGSEDVAVDLSGSTGATTLSTTQMPSHTHPFSAVISTKGRYMENGNLYDSGSSSTSATGGNGSHTHPLSGSVSGTHTDPHLAMHFFIKVV